MARTVLSEDERVVVAAIATFCVSWQFPEERRTMLGLIAHHLPNVRRQVPLIDLIAAAELFQAAQGPHDWACAKKAAVEALLPVFRIDMMLGGRKGEVRS